MGSKSKISFKRVVQAVKSPTFIGFTIVSTALSLILYISSGVEGYEKFFLAVTALSLEGLKLYSLLMGNVYSDYVRASAKKASKKIRDLVKIDELIKSINRKAKSMYAIYALAALVSIFGSYNFTLATTEKSVRANIALQGASQTPEEVKLTSNLEFWTSEIERLNKKIRANEESAAALPPEYATSKKRYQDSNEADAKIISSYEASATEAKYQLALIEADKLSKNIEIKKSSFQIIAEGLSTDTKTVTAQDILIIFLLITSFLIEVGLVVASPHEDTFNIFEGVEARNELPVKAKEFTEESPPRIVAQKKKYYKKKKEEAPTPTPAPEVIKEDIPKEPEPEEPLIQEEPIASPPDPEPPVEKKIARVEVREGNPVHDLLRNILPEGGVTGFIRKENLNSVPELKPLQIKEIFNNLARSKGPTGFPIFEFRKDQGKWYSNYPLNEILTILDKGLSV